jgi:hypothetical protein
MKLERLGGELKLKNEPLSGRLGACERFLDLSD